MEPLFAGFAKGAVFDLFSVLAYCFRFFKTLICVAKH
jgi:hypothetical protein